MVAFLPLLAGILALVGIGQVLKPRLPHYTFRINQFPMIQWINGSFKTKLGAGVSLQNDNYVPIDVHSLSFDLYYPNRWASTTTSSTMLVEEDYNDTDGFEIDLYEYDGKTTDGLSKQKKKNKSKKTSSSSSTIAKTFNNLVHIGQVQDKHQQEQPKPKKGFLERLKKRRRRSSSSDSSSELAIKSSSAIEQYHDISINDANELSSSISSTSSHMSHKPPLWEMLPRQLFETVDHVFMEPYNVGHVGVMTSLSWDILKSGFGTLQIPSSGVIQVKANKKLPLTMSIICDNVLNTWTMTMSGVSCELSNIELGWNNMELAISKLRNEVLTKPIKLDANYNVVMIDENETARSNDKNNMDKLSSILNENGIVMTETSSSSSNNVMSDLVKRLGGSWGRA